MIGGKERFVAPEWPAGQQTSRSNGVFWEASNKGGVRVEQQIIWQSCSEGLSLSEIK